MNASSSKRNAQRFSLQKRLMSFAYAFNGLRVLLQEEHNSRIHIAAAIAINILGVFLKFSTFEWISIWLCISSVFITEIVNTAIENICDHVSPEQNITIGRIKDLAAAAVFVASLTSVIIAVLILVNHR